MTDIEQNALRPGLYVVGTPIGHLGDISARGLEVLGHVHAVLAEDTRQTRKLMSRFDLHTPLISCHHFNEARRIGAVLERLSAGEALALVTDSGMPGVSDPGARVVAACRDAGYYMTVVPGPTAAASALALSGYGGGPFVFEGFLPHKSGARARRLSALLEMNMAVILYESPYRLLRLLGEIHAVAPDRDVFVARELTKLHEECLWGPALTIAARFEGRTVKGEITVVIPPAGKSA
jgi:16S rRNA (cytidine1402-2'-O)-methyltransferase